MIGDTVPSIYSFVEAGTEVIIIIIIIIMMIYFNVHSIYQS